MGDIVQIDHLRVAFNVQGRLVDAVADASIRIAEGGAVGLVGESGSGKSTLARTLMGLLGARPAVLKADAFVVDGRSLDIADSAGVARLRGRTFAMVFQDPLSYLNPLMTVGDQIRESVIIHDERRQASQRVGELLDLVHLPRRVETSYPHELSGGMRQRALLAIALSCKPRLLLADEPTTALDVTTQMEILTLLREVRQELRMAILLISHDLVSVASLCDDVYVMYRGQTIEHGPRRRVFHEPQHAYTKTLLAAARAKRPSRATRSELMPTGQIVREAE